jgi:hypothetical protein
MEALLIFLFPAIGISIAGYFVYALRKKKKNH